MRQVWKYRLELVGHQVLHMPAGAELLHLGIQPASTVADDSSIVLWADVDPAVGVVPREFYVRGTGHGIPDDVQQYVGTVQQGSFVWHVFERRVG